MKSFSDDDAKIRNRIELLDKRVKKSALVAGIAAIIATVSLTIAFMALTIA